MFIFDYLPALSQSSDAKSPDTNEPNNLKGNQLELLKIALIIIFIFAGLNKITAEDNTHLKNGIVKIYNKGTSDRVETGVGIIVAADSAKVYILTAWHVVRGDDEFEEDLIRKKIVVQFYGDQQQLPVGHLYPSFDEELDLAVVTVDATTITGLEVRPTLGIGNVEKIKNLDEVIALGHPGNKQWLFTSGDIQTVDHLRLNFSGDAISPGNSGGALLNSKYHLIGMVTHLTAESGIAIRIDIAIDKLNEWNIPLQLKPAKTSKKWLFIGVGVVAVGGAIVAATLSSSGDGKDNEPPVLNRPPKFPGDQ